MRPGQGGLDGTRGHLQEGEGLPERQQGEGCPEERESEDVSDKLLTGVADAANKVTGGKFEEQIESARADADKKIGTE
jgi:hypothetical protein